MSPIGMGCITSTFHLDALKPHQHKQCTTNKVTSGILTAAAKQVQRTPISMYSLDIFGQDILTT
jgi:hypothetical protein